MAPSTWPTIRDNILENVRTVLAAIATGDTYILTMKKVSRDLIHIDQVKQEEFPALFISPEVEDLEHTTFQKVHSVLAITLTGYVRTSTGALTQVELEKVIHDVKVAMYQDMTRGGYAVNTFVGPQIVIDKSVAPPLAKVEISLTIAYRNTFGAP